MDFLRQFTSPDRIAAGVVAVLLALAGLAYWMAQRWVGHVDADLDAKGSKTDLAKLEKEIQLLHKRFLAAAQRAAGAFVNIAEMKREIAALTAELEKHRETSMAEVRRLEDALEELRRDVWREP